MRDGPRLFTSVYVPKDVSKQHPILLLRTPYRVAPYGIDNYKDSFGANGDRFAREGFILAYQDVRGKGKSEGVFQDVRPQNANRSSRNQIDESTDTWDTIDWLVKNVPNNNGRVGLWGISYPGFYAAMGAVDAHPALKAVSPQAPVSNWFIGDDWRHNGAVMLAHTFGFFAGFGRPKQPEHRLYETRFEMGTPDGYDFHLATGGLGNYDEKYFQGQIEFWKEVVENDTYSEFWQARNILPHMKKVKPAMLTVGGWFDAEDLWGALHVYQAAEKQSPGAVNMLVMGPWSHGQWAGEKAERLGNVNFGSNTSKYFQENIELAFFLWYLSDKGDGGKLPEAYMFETGRNEWHKLEAWPPKEAQTKKLFFRSGGQLQWDVPSDKGEAYDEYVSDPARPVPFLSFTAGGMAPEYMTDDQRHASRRTDVLTYQTEPVENDLRVAGPLKASLFVSTSGTDSDFVVKLVDGYPDGAPDPSPNPWNVRMGGYQQLVRGEPFRGKFRSSFEKPEPFTPGRVEKVEFELPDVFHAFRRGHRIMIQVQSTWFPLVDRNPQKFMKIQNAKAEDFQKATQRVYRSVDKASGVALSVLP